MVEQEPPPDDFYHYRDEHDCESSLQAARADLELLQAAYPDEIDMDDDTRSDNAEASNFPLTARLHFSKTASCQLQWRHGYPATSTVEIISCRAKDSHEQQWLEQALHAWRSMAREWEGQEGVGLVCCAAAMEAWNNSTTSEGVTAAAEIVDDENAALDQDADEDYSNKKDRTHQQAMPSLSHDYIWISGEPLVDRKSTFQAHVCRLQKEADVAAALHQLLTSSSKMQRATHHMYAYRIVEQHHPVSGSGKKDLAENLDTTTTTTILKHDNSDDGEDGAGSRLAHLLQMRQDQDVLVVVSRWYGGIPLGPKRFAHISNAARTLLVQQQQEGNSVHPKGKGKK